MLKIVVEPDPILRKKANLEKVDDELRKLMDEMLQIMYPGIGLAAVQIGILKN